MPRSFCSAPSALGLLSLCALTLGTAAFSPAAQAQTLDLYTNAAATLNSKGTTASGAYVFQDAAYNSAPLEPARTDYADWFLLGSGSSAGISGGTVGGLHLSDGSAAKISGGTVTHVYAQGVGQSSLVTLSGGAVGFVETLGSGIVNFQGIDLLKSATTTAFDDGNYFKITGTFLGSTVPFTSYYADSGSAGTLEFNGDVVSPASVPEASSVVSFGLLLALSGAGLAVRRRAKAAAR